MEGMIGEVRGFAGNFAPRTWAFCEGQLLAIASNTALFSILGTTYGGDGRTSFALPDLRGRAFIGAGTGPGLTPRSLGARTGQQSVVLITTQIPSHTHSLNCNGTDGSGTENTPQNHFPAVGQTDRSTGDPFNTNWSTTANAQMNSLAIGNTGGTQSHTNMQPSLAMHYIICMQGVFPSRN